jgi:hypothetical protein
MGPESWPAVREDAFIGIRDELFPDRTVDSVYMVARGVACLLGWDSPANHRTAQATKRLVEEFQANPEGWSRIAHNLELLRRIQPVPADVMA